MKKIFSLVLIFQVALVLVFSTNCSAQGPSAEDIRAQMLKDWQRGKEYTIEYLNTMPAAKYSFRPVDSIRSFAMQMLHLASGNVFLMSTAVGQAPPAWVKSDPEHRPSAQTKDSVMYYIVSSYDYCIGAVKSFDMSKWAEKQKLFGTYEETRLSLMNKTFEHQTHHRGQTTIYIRLNGIKPPEEKLF